MDVDASRDEPLAPDTTASGDINLEEKMEAEVHFGHGTRKLNPRMS